MLPFCFSLQICVNVQVPEEFGGVSGSAIFIDTNFGFYPERLHGNYHL